MSLTVLGANRLDEQCVIAGWECQSSKQKKKTKAAWEELRGGRFNYNGCVFWGGGGGGVSHYNTLWTLLICGVHERDSFY